MLKYIMPKGASKAISDIVTALFNRAKARFLGKNYKSTEIQIGFITKPLEHREDLSLPGIFDASSKAEGVVPNEKLKESCIDIAEQYFDAHKEATKANVLNAVQSFLHEAQTNTNTDPDETLREVLEKVVEKATSSIQMVTDSETNRAKNMSAIDAISKMAAIEGVSDPVVYFANPNDGHTCDQCKRICFLSDGFTPRVWLMSELSFKYFRRGDPFPSICGQHPNCRCACCTVLPGYGFKGGRLEYIGPDYNVLLDQRGSA